MEWLQGRLDVYSKKTDKRFQRILRKYRELHKEMEDMKEDRFSIHRRGSKIRRQVYTDDHSKTEPDVALSPMCSSDVAIQLKPITTSRSVYETKCSEHTIQTKVSSYSPTIPTLFVTSSANGFYFSGDTDKIKDILLRYSGTRMDQTNNWQVSSYKDMKDILCQLNTKKISCLFLK